MSVVSIGSRCYRASMFCGPRVLGRDSESVSPKGKKEKKSWDRLEEAKALFASVRLSISLIKIRGPVPCQQRLTAVPGGRQAARKI